VKLASEMPIANASILM